MNLLLKWADWMTRLTMQWFGHPPDTIDIAMWYSRELHKGEMDMWNRGLKAVHASGMAVVLATGLVFVFGGAGGVGRVWGQQNGNGLMQGERILITEQQMKYMDSRVEKLEAAQADTRIRLVESAIADIKETTSQNKWLTLGQLAGLLGIGAGQVVIVRGGRRRRVTRGGEDGYNGPEVNENAD